MNPNENLLIHIPDAAGIGNTLKGFITALSLSDGAAIQVNPNSILGDFSTVLHPKHITCGNKQYNPFSTCRFLILKSEEDVQQNLLNEFSSSEVDMSNPKYRTIFSTTAIDWYYDRSLVADKVYNRIMQAIDKIQFLDCILSEVERVSSTFVHPTLAVSVRTWKAPHEHNISRRYNKDEYYRAINKYTGDTSYNVQSILVSYDNTDYAHEYEQFLASKNIQIIQYIQPDYINHLQHAVIKMLLCSKADYFVGNRISTYSELVFWFGRCKQDVTTVF